ncbi:hypothetical protein ACFX2I_020216 [Malus domestica]
MIQHYVDVNDEFWFADDPEVPNVQHHRNFLKEHVFKEDFGRIGMGLGLLSFGEGFGDGSTCRLRETEIGVGGLERQARFCSRDLFDDKPILLQSSSTTKSIRRLTVAHLAFPSPSHSLPELESVGERRGMAGRGREREKDKSRRAPCRSGCLAKYNQVTVMTHGKASSL